MNKIRSTDNAASVRKFKALQYSELLQEIERDVDQALDLQAVLDLVLKRAVELVGASDGSIMRLEDDGRLHFRARIGELFPLGRVGRTFTPGSKDEGVAGWVARNRQPYICRDTKTDKQFVGIASGSPIRSMVCVPIVSHGVVLGVINVDSPELKRFSVADRELLAALASQVARAVERAELLEGLQEISEKTLSRAADLYQSIVNTIHSLTRCSVAMWRVDDKDRSRAGIVAQHGLREKYVKGRVLDLNKSATGVAIDTGRLIEVVDIQSDSRVALETKEEAATQGWTSILLVPLMAGISRAVGTVNIYRSSTDRATVWEKNLLQVFASQAGTAVLNAERLQAIQHLGQVGQSLATLQESPDVLQVTLKRIADAALEVLGADLVDLYEYRAVRNEFALPPIMVGARRYPELKPRTVFPDDVVARVARTKTQVYASDAQTHTVLTGDWDTPRKGLPKERFVVREGIVSSAALPMLISDEVLGVLFVSYRQRRDFEAESELKERIEEFARLGAVAINNARRSQELSDGAVQLEKLQGITAMTAGATADLNEVTQLIVQNLSLLFGTASCGIRLYHKETDEFDRQVGTGPLQYIFDLPPRSDGVSRYILRTKTPRYLEGDELVVPTDGGPALRTELMAREPKAAAYLPLLSKDELIGILYVDISTPHRFSENDKLILRLYTDQAAVAIQNARLLQSERQRADALGLLREISEKVSSTLDLDETLAAIVEGAMRLTQTDTGVIYLVNETGQAITRSLEYPVGFHPTPRFSTANSLTRTIVDTGLPINVPDIAKDLRVNQEVLKKGVKSLIGVPLKFGGKVTGALFLNAKQPRQFTQEHLTLLLPLAERAATAIQNATAYGAIQVVQRISKSMSQTLDLGTILHQVVDGAVNLVHADSGVIHLIDEIKEEITNNYESPQGSGHLKPRFDEKRGLTWRIFKAGRAIEISDISQAGLEVRERDWEDRKALIGLPLKLANKVSGVLFLYSKKPRVFTASEKDLLTTLTEQAALAIDNAQRYKQRERDIAALEEINSALTTKSQKEIVELIVQKAKELTGAEYCGLWLADRGRLVLGAMYGTGSLEAPNLPIDKHSINGWAAHERELYVCIDVANDHHYQVWNPSVLSSAAAPMILRGELVGTLSIESVRPSAFSTYQLGLLRSLAEQAAIAIANARLYERRIKELEVLSQIYERIIKVGIESVNAILDLIYVEACKVLDLADAQVQFAFYDETNDEVTFPLAIEQDKETGGVIDVVRWGKRDSTYAQKGGDETVEAYEPRHRNPKTRFGLTEYVIGTKSPVLITEDFQNRANDLRLGEFQVRVLPKFGISERPTHSWLGVPMVVQGRVIGVISIQSLEQENAFDESHLELLSAVANQAAVAIVNARLYQEARGEVVAAKQLATLGTAMAALRHRINNTFNVIVPNVTRLKKRVDATDATIAEILDIIERNARYTSDIIARIQEPLREMEVQDVNVNAVLDEAIAWAQEKWSVERVALPISLESQLADPLPQVQAPIGQLTEVFRNLLDNSYRAMQERGGKLTVLSCLTDGIICVRVRDTGPGIALPKAQRLFEKPVPSKEPGGGAGLGLWLSRLMLQSIGGNVTIESVRTSEPTGTTMLVQIPALPARGKV